MTPVPFCFTALTSVQSQCDCAPFRLATSGVVITWRSIMAALDAVAVKLQKLLANAEPTGPFGCLNYKYGKGMGNYARYHMRYPLGPHSPAISAQMHASRAVYIFHHRRPDMVGEPGTGQISHCNNPRCVNIKHLTLESAASNCQRKHCKAANTCLGCIPPCMYPLPV